MKPFINRARLIDSSLSIIALLTYYVGCRVILLQRDSISQKFLLALLIGLITILILMGIRIVYIMFYAKYTCEAYRIKGSSSRKAYLLYKVFAKPKDDIRYVVVSRNGKWRFLFKGVIRRAVKHGKTRR